MEHFSLNCRGRLLDISRPVVMGILNLTPDSFYDGGQFISKDQILTQAELMLQAGAKIIDLGGMSSRPGAKLITAEAELERVLPAVKHIRKAFPEAYVSIDTIYSLVAEACLEEGAHIINDISAWSYDPLLPEIVAKYGAPYILMHKQGDPENMQHAPSYDDVLVEVLDFFIEKLDLLSAMGVRDVVIDPGFGFGKSVIHNYRLLKYMQSFAILNRPVLAGLSRKSMICKVLGVNPPQALNGTTALHMTALEQGARILRVHDVKEAVQCIQLWEQLQAV
ncbi:MAG: dihydropteroate synthase [Bacteroidota bacterium]